MRSAFWFACIYVLDLGWGVGGGGQAGSGQGGVIKRT